MIEEKSGYSNGILRYPVSMVDHKETIKDPVQDDADKFRGHDVVLVYQPVEFG